MDNISAYENVTSAYKAWLKSGESLPSPIVYQIDDKIVISDECIKDEVPFGIVLKGTENGNEVRFVIPFTPNTNLGERCGMPEIEEEDKLKFSLTVFILACCMRESKWERPNAGRFFKLEHVNDYGSCRDVVVFADNTGLTISLDRKTEVVGTDPDTGFDITTTTDKWGLVLKYAPVIKKGDTKFVAFKI